MFALVLWIALAVSDTITAIQVHGNTLTPDDDIRRIAGVSAGASFDDHTIEKVTERLRASKRFERVEVLKRYASIDDPSQILLVIVVDEGPVQIKTTGDSASPVRVVKSRRAMPLILPVLNAEDGYGFTYGARLAWPNPIGKQSRLAFPVTWGGDKRGTVEFEKFLRGPIDRVSAGASVSRRRNPHYEVDDTRARWWARGEGELLPHLRAGATAGWQRVKFPQVAGGPRETGTFPHAGADVTLDTRVDPTLPRNAVLARAAWEHIAGANRTDLDARGYIGVGGQAVVALRAARSDADRPLPLFLKPLLGGMSNVRGFKAGTDAGDTLVATSAELILPLSSPLSIGRLGVNVFIDAGAAYDKGEPLRDQTWRQGAGAGIWVSAAFLKFNVAVAHGRGGTTRVHVGANVAF